MEIIHPKVLFVSNKDDFALDYLIYKFQHTGVEYIRINSEDIINMSIKYNLNDIQIIYNDILYNLDEVKSVYFRRAPSIFPNSIDNRDTQYINGERRNFFEGIYTFLDAKWINPIFATYKAERKLYQLSIAKRIGFNVPETIVSNNPVDIIEFLNEHESCIIKPISHGMQVTSEGIFSIYTSDIKDIKSLNKDMLFECPTFVQEKINNYRDIRATFIGNEVLAVEIDTDDELKVDWRKPELAKRYKIHCIPEEIKQLMFKLHKELDLVYSAFDFVLTPEGKYFFLETNPAGEWVWLERELGLPISRAIINELLL